MNILNYNMTGNDITAIGTRATRNVRTGRHCTFIGAQGPTDESNTTWTGDSVHVTRTFASGIRNRSTRLANAKPVLINVISQIGTANTAHRYKIAAADIAAVRANLKTWPEVEK